MIKRTLTLIVVVSSFTSPAHADPASLGEAKASARRVAEGTCPLVRLVSKVGKAKPDSPEYNLLRDQIDEESKKLNDLRAEETERLRTLGPKLTIKEGQELNEYIDGPLSKTCDVKSF
jgi:hypothetical protein